MFSDAKEPLVWRMYPEVPPALVGREDERLEVTFEAWADADKEQRSDIFCWMADQMFHIRAVRHKGKPLAAFRHLDMERERYALLFFLNEKAP